jgi:hypothetical protein
MKLSTSSNAIFLYIWTTKYKSIIVGEKVYSCFQDGMTGTSIYVRSYIVCFKCFLLVSVCYISYKDFQTKVYKLVAVIVYARLKKKSWLFVKTQWIVYLRGFSVFIYAKTVGS